MSATVGVTGNEMRDGTITDLQISDSALIKELKILFDTISGHHHNGIDSRLISGGGSALDFVFDSSFTGAIDGSNRVFTLPANFVANSVSVYRNGLRQKRTTHFVELGSNQIEFVTAPPALSRLVFDFITA